MKTLKMIGLLFPIVFFPACIDLFGNDEEDDESLSEVPPEELTVEKIEEATLSFAQWEWGLVATSQALGETSTFVCTTDTINGGYLALFQNSNHSLIFSLNDDFKVQHFSQYSTGYVVDYGNDKVYVMSTDEDGYVYQVYDAVIEREARDTPFESIAAGIEAFRAQIDIVQPWFTDAYSMLLDAVLNGDAESLPVVAYEPYVENYGPAINKSALVNLSQALFGNVYPRVGGFNVNSDSIKTVTVYISEEFPLTTCRRGQNAIEAGQYGEEVENKIYCGLAIGKVSQMYGITGPYLTLGNAMYNVAPVLVSDVKAGIEFSLPEELSLGGSYLVCPYLISADDAADMEAGYEVNSALLRYCLSPYPYYNIDADIESIVVEKCTYHETSDLSAAFKVKARINPPADMESVIERWGIVVRKSGDSLGDNMIMADGEDKYSHTFEFVQQIYRGDCKIDEENYKATCDLEILIYVDIYPYVHYLVPRSYTVVYDEKPSIRYTQASLVTELCDVENHNVMEDAIHYAYEVTGAFWLDDNLVTYWDGPEGWHKGGTSYMGDYVIEGDFFYSHFLFTDLHPTTEYLIATRHGVEFMSSNHLVFGWSGDKVTSVEIVE